MANLGAVLKRQQLEEVNGIDPAQAQTPTTAAPSSEPSPGVEPSYAPKEFTGDNAGDFSPQQYQDDGTSLPDMPEGLPITNSREPVLDQIHADDPEYIKYRQIGLSAQAAMTQRHLDRKLRISPESGAEADKPLSEAMGPAEVIAATFGGAPAFAGRAVVPFLWRTPLRSMARAAVDYGKDFVAGNLTKRATMALTSSITNVPILATAEEIGEEHPWLGFAAGIGLGAISAATIERGINRAAYKAIDGADSVISKLAQNAAGTVSRAKAGKATLDLYKTIEKGLNTGNFGDPKVRDAALNIVKEVEGSVVSGAKTLTDTEVVTLNRLKNAVNAGPPNQVTDVPLVGSTPGLIAQGLPTSNGTIKVSNKKPEWFDLDALNSAYKTGGQPLVIKHVDDVIRKVYAQQLQAHIADPPLQDGKTTPKENLDTGQQFQPKVNDEDYLMAAEMYGHVSDTSKPMPDRLDAAAKALRARLGGGYSEHVRAAVGLRKFLDSQVRAFDGTPFSHPIRAIADRAPILMSEGAKVRKATQADNRLVGEPLLKKLSASLDGLDIEKVSGRRTGNTESIRRAMLSSSNPDKQVEEFVNDRLGVLVDTVVALKAKGANAYKAQEYIKSTSELIPQIAERLKTADGPVTEKAVNKWMEKFTGQATPLKASASATAPAAPMPGAPSELVPELGQSYVGGENPPLPPIGKPKGQTNKAKTWAVSANENVPPPRGEYTDAGDAPGMEIGKSTATKDYGFNETEKVDPKSIKPVMVDGVPYTRVDPDLPEEFLQFNIIHEDPSARPMARTIDEKVNEFTSVETTETRMPVGSSGPTAMIAGVDGKPVTWDMKVDDWMIPKERWYHIAPAPQRPDALPIEFEPTLMTTREGAREVFYKILEESKKDTYKYLKYYSNWVVKNGKKVPQLTNHSLIRGAELMRFQHDSSMKWGDREKEATSIIKERISGLGGPGTDVPWLTRDETDALIAFLRTYDRIKYEADRLALTPFKEQANALVLVARGEIEGKDYIGARHMMQYAREQLGLEYDEARRRDPNYAMKLEGEGDHMGIVGRPKPEDPDTFDYDAKTDSDQTVMSSRSVDKLSGEEAIAADEVDGEGTALLQAADYAYAGGDGRGFQYADQIGTGELELDAVALIKIGQDMQASRMELAKGAGAAPVTYRTIPLPSGQEIAVPEFNHARIASGADLGDVLDTWVLRSDSPYRTNHNRNLLQDRTGLVPSNELMVNYVNQYGDAYEASLMQAVSLADKVNTDGRVLDLLAFKKQLLMSNVIGDLIQGKVNPDFTQYMERISMPNTKSDMELIQKATQIFTEEYGALYNAIGENAFEVDKTMANLITAAQGDLKTLTAVAKGVIEVYNNPEYLKAVKDLTNVTASTYADIVEQLRKACS